MNNNNNYINHSRPHDSAIKHVSGIAEYTDDIKEPPGTVFGAIGWSKKAKSIIKKIYLKHIKFLKDLMMIFRQYVVHLVF